MSIYDKKPERFLERLHAEEDALTSSLYCAGFAVEKWRCSDFAFHLAEWLPDYALPEEELQVDHGNSLQKLSEAAVRVYTSAKYEERGEAGEIALHAICRDFFDTIPISPRVFYKSASNDVVKAFDMVHARFPDQGKPEIWFGESKLYTDAGGAIGAAIMSIRKHIDEGFLSNQKLLLGPQIPKSTPRYDEVIEIFKRRASVDDLISRAVFAVGILCDSNAASTAKARDQEYTEAVKGELAALTKKLRECGLCDKLKLVLIYIPLASKATLVEAFDRRLKGLQ